VNSHSHKPSASDSMLTSVAESIGATLGTLAAKADALQKALVKPSERKNRGIPQKSNARKSTRGRRGRRPATARTSSKRRSKARRSRSRAAR
jgi:hypothetical protein